MFTHYLRKTGCACGVAMFLVTGAGAHHGAHNVDASGPHHAKRCLSLEGYLAERSEESNRQQSAVDVQLSSEHSHVDPMQDEKAGGESNQPELCCDHDSQATAMITLQRELFAPESPFLVVRCDRDVSLFLLQNLQAHSGYTLLPFHPPRVSA
ncbi:MAG: hypothetical protein HY644_07950 [Acidobacteria bacterium]|nr:hypothetical protein [Acidobacteriota bacterium]